MVKDPLSVTDMSKAKGVVVETALPPTTIGIVYEKVREAFAKDCMNSRDCISVLVLASKFFFRWPKEHANNPELKPVMDSAYQLAVVDWQRDLSKAIINDEPSYAHIITGAALSAGSAGSAEGL